MVAESFLCSILYIKANWQNTISRTMNINYLVDFNWELTVSEFINKTIAHQHFLKISLGGVVGKATVRILRMIHAFTNFHFLKK